MLNPPPRRGKPDKLCAPSMQQVPVKCFSAGAVRPPCRHPDKKTHARFNGQPRPRSTTQSENFYKCKHKRQQRNETYSLVILHLVACEMV
jgi:hypothetical protein